MVQEQQLLEQQTKEIEKWFGSERFSGVRRPYSARHVASLRGTFRQEYGSNAQAKKLWSLLKTHQKNKTASHTFGALDPIQVAQMAKYIETVYVSGWQSSSTASTSNEPGPDLADYPVPLLHHYRVIIPTYPLRWIRSQTRLNICGLLSCFMTGSSFMSACK